VAAIAAKPVAPLRATLAEEFDRAVAIRRQAAGLVRTVMQDARLGKAVEMDKVSPVVENITESILRNARRLLGLSYIKNKDDYTFLHSVSVCTCWWPSAARARWTTRPSTRPASAACCTIPARRWCRTIS
jgi:hypothetical protein